jgi:hypothetical protein
MRTAQSVRIDASNRSGRILKFMEILRAGVFTSAWSKKASESAVIFRS